MVSLDTCHARHPLTSKCYVKCREIMDIVESRNNFESTKFDTAAACGQYRLLLGFLYSKPGWVEL